MNKRNKKMIEADIELVEERKMENTAIAKTEVMPANLDANTFPGPGSPSS